MFKCVVSYGLVRNQSDIVLVVYLLFINGVYWDFFWFGCVIGKNIICNFKKVVCIDIVSFKQLV